MTIQLNPTVSDAYESKTLAQMRQLVFDGMGFISTYLTTRTETLAAIRTDLYNMLGYAAMVIVPSGVNAMLNSYINNAQQMLFRSLETAGIYATQSALPPAVLVNDTDVTVFDGQAIRQLALGMAKGHKGQEDGQLYVAASGKFLKDLAERLPPNAVTNVNRILKDAQIELYRQYSVFRMQRWFTWTLAAGVRFYGIAANDERSAIASPTGVTVTAGTLGTYGSLNTGRGTQTATLLLDGRILFAGGVDAVGTNLTTAEIYDTDTGLFTLTGSMADGRTGHTENLLSDGRVLIAAGQNSAYLSTAEVWSPSGNAFTPVGPLNFARNFHRSAMMLDGRVLIVGGGTNTLVTQAEIFTPSNNTFTTTGALAHGRFDPAVAVQANGNVICAGGDGAGVRVDIEVFTPSLGTWAIASGVLSVARTNATAIRLGNGKILIAGGFNGGGTSQTACDLFDPSTGGAAATGALGTARGKPKLSILPNGKVLATGGLGNAGALATAEVYDPGAGTWTATTGPMSVAREDHTATYAPLKFKVYVVGGFTNVSPTPYSSAEIYDYTTSTFLPSGLHSSGSRSYRVAFGDANGKNTLPSVEVTTVIAGDTSILVGWTIPTNPAVKYAIIYGRTAGLELRIAQVDASLGQYTDTGTIVPSGAMPTTNTTGNVGPILDQRSLMRVYASQNDVNWRPLSKPVPPLAYTNQVSGIPTWYDIREAIEIWPPPPDSTWQLRILGAFTLGAFDVDTDATSLDWQAIHLFALAKAKAAWNRPDAKLAMGEAQAYVGELVAGSHGTARYLPGGRILPPVTRPLMIPPFP